MRFATVIQSVVRVFVVVVVGVIVVAVVSSISSSSSSGSSRSRSSSSSRRSTSSIAGGGVGVCSASSSSSANFRSSQGVVALLLRHSPLLLRLRLPARLVPTLSRLSVAYRAPPRGFLSSLFQGLAARWSGFDPSATS